MDPLTHALLGSAAARVALARPLGRAAFLPGAVGALLPDVDALVRSSSDPLLYAEFHRHVTHALAFIPVGGAVAALPWLLRRDTRGRRLAFLGAATAGYATHGVLDASTTYGTSLWFPFSDTRVAWNIISIIDPLFTAVLVAGVACAVWRRSAIPAAAALLVCAGWLALGGIQRERAAGVQAQLALARGHAVERAAVFPGFATTLVWRSLYEADGMLYMDRLRVPWRGSPTWRPGPAVPPLRVETLPDAVRGDPRVTRDVARFLRFSDGWIARSPGDPDVIADARYTDSYDRFEPVWGIRVGSGAVPIAWVDRSRERRVDPGALWEELRGNDPAYQALPRGTPNGTE